MPNITGQFIRLLRLNLKNIFRPIKSLTFIFSMNYIYPDLFIGRFIYKLDCGFKKKINLAQAINNLIGLYILSNFTN